MPKVLDTHEQIGSQHVPKEALKQWLLENATRIGFRPKIRGNCFFAVPSTTHVFATWAFGILRLLTNEWKEGDVITSRPPTLIHLARQEMVEIFLDQTQCEWLMWIDDDVVPPITALTDLIETGKKCVTGLYHFKEEPYAPVWYQHPVFDEEKEVMTYKQMWKIPSEGLVELASAGLGCMLVHRDVIEKIEQPAFSLHESAEDHGFTRRVIDAGFKLYGHPGVQCTHVHTMGVTTGHWLAMNDYVVNNPEYVDQISGFTVDGRV